MGDDLVMQSCYEGNEEQCNGYLPCLVLSKAFADTESNNTFSNTNASSSETQSTTVPSIPSASFELATPTLDSLIEVQEEPELPVAASSNMTATIESQNEFQATINTTAYNEHVQSIINSTAYAPIPTTLDYFNNSEEADLSVTSTQELGKLPVVAETAMESQQNEFQSNVNATSYATFPMLDYNPYNNVDDNLSTWFAFLHKFVFVNILVQSISNNQKYISSFVHTAEPSTKKKDTFRLTVSLIPIVWYDIQSKQDVSYVIRCTHRLESI